MVQKNLAQRQAAPLRQQVTQLLKNDILEGVYLPGDRLIENNLCERYGVSRTVVREVLRLLESDHLVTVVPMQGPIVTVLSEQDIANLYLVRAHIESMMIKLFMQNATPEMMKQVQHLYDTVESHFLNGTVAERWVYKDSFYDLLSKGANNNVLEEMIVGIQARVGLFKHFAFVYEDRIRQGYLDLQLILSAILSGDIALACQHNDEHLLDAGKAAIINYQKRLKNLPGQNPTPDTH